jgi:hypothetical protein
MIENLDEFAVILIQNYSKIFSSEGYEILGGYVTTSENFKEGFKTIDYNVKRTHGNGKAENYSTTHAYVYCDINKVYILQHGTEKDINIKHWDYISKNLAIFERDIKITQVLDD